MNRRELLREAAGTGLAGIMSAADAPLTVRAFRTGNAGAYYAPGSSSGEVLLNYEFARTARLSSAAT